MNEVTTKPAVSLVGRQFVLWIVHYSAEATRDGAGRKHDGFVVDEEVPVVVVEEKPVKGQFFKGNFIGIKARAADGREFTRHWDSYPDDAFSGADMTWYLQKDKPSDPFVHVKDACLAHRDLRRLCPCVDADGTLKVPLGAEICNRHDRAFLPEVGCEDCRYDEREGRKYIKCPHCPTELPVDDLPAQRLHMETVHPDESARIDEENRRLDGWADV